MKTILIIGTALALMGCNGKKAITLPPPPTNTTVVEHNIPIPVLCTVEINRTNVKIDSAEEKLKLEEQNALLRESLAQMKSYVIALEAGIIGCGGKIK